MPQLSTRERNEFLDSRGILMRIAVVRQDGSPLVTPIWFLHEDDSIYFTPRAESEWLPCLKRDPRVALCIDEQPLPYRKVIIEGAAQLLADLGEDADWRDRYRRIACRYIPDDAADAYIENTIDQPRALFKVALQEATVRTWRMPEEGEPGDGIWHQRYYGAGTKLKRDL